MNNPFIHLRSLSSYSLSESTLKISNLVNLAKKNNMPLVVYGSGIAIREFIFSKDLPPSLL